MSESGLTAENAAEALQAAWAADNDPSPAPVVEESPFQPQDTAPSGDTQSNQDTGSPDSGLFYGVDPNTLSPENRKIFDGMQAAFTQKSQKFAEERKAYESLGDIEQVKQAVEWVRGLDDPQNLVKLQSEISEHLQSLGISPQAANAAAAQEVQAAVSELEEDDFGFNDPGTEALRREVQEMKQWKADLEAERLQQSIELRLSKQEQAIRQANPSYKDEDIESIYRLSYAYGADLAAAQTAYEADRNRILSSYMEQKAEIPASMSAPAPTGGSHTPVTFGNDLDAAHAFAKEHIQRMMNSGSLDA